MLQKLIKNYSLNLFGRSKNYAAVTLSNWIITGYI